MSILFGIILFLLGIGYAFVIFYFSSSVDRKAYDNGITFTKKQVLKFAFYCFIWPITMWLPNIWKL